MILPIRVQGAIAERVTEVQRHASQTGDQAPEPASTPPTSDPAADATAYPS